MRECVKADTCKLVKKVEPRNSEMLVMILQESAGAMVMGAVVIQQIVPRINLDGTLAGDRGIRRVSTNSIEAMKVHANSA